MLVLFSGRFGEPGKGKNITEKEAIEAAQAATVQKLTTILFDAFVQFSAPDARRQAEERFQIALPIAREARDKAKTLTDNLNP